MSWIMILIAVVILSVIIGNRSANEGWTRGSNLFKDSEYNLEKDKKLDPSDYDYYNKKGKMK